MGGFPMDRLDSGFYKKLETEMEGRSEHFLKALEQDNDRATAIISACLLDNLLERLIRAFYVKDPAVKLIFKTDHILQSFFSKKYCLLFRTYTKSHLSRF